MSLIWKKVQLERSLPRQLSTDLAPYIAHSFVFENCLCWVANIGQSSICDELVDLPNFFEQPAPDSGGDYSPTVGEKL